jgi:hydrogenase-4 membrane subunit HyfE
MRKGAQLHTAGILALLVFLMVPRPAHAYIDPGSGSLIWQVLIAALLSGLFLIKTYWRRFKQIIGRADPTQGEGAEELEEE